MNPVYVTILFGILQFIGTLLFLSWKKGKDDEKLEVLREAHNELTDDFDRMKDVNIELSKEVANIRGYLKGQYGAPINGNTN